MNKNGTPKANLHVQRTRLRLRRQWLRLGLLPVLGVVMLAIAASTVHAADADMSSRRVELRLQAAMALAAAAFLAGFWLEGYRTDGARILRSVARDSGKQLGDLTRELVAAYAQQVEDLIVEAHWQALAFGWAAALVTAVAALVGMPVGHCVIVGCIAVLYQLYLLSRHWHAVELMAAVASGDLAAEAQILAAQSELKLTLPQRLAMLFGWRPRPRAQGNPGKRRRPRR